MLKLIATSGILWAFAGCAAAVAQMGAPPPFPMQNTTVGQPMGQIQPFQPVAPADQQPDVAMSPDGQPMGLVVPFGGNDSSGGPGVVVVPYGQPVGVVPGQ